MAIRFILGKRGTGILRIVFMVLVLLVFVFTSNLQALAATCPDGMSQLDCDSLYGGWTAWVPDDGSGACGVTTDETSGGVTDAQLHLTADQIAIVQAIIGIAKTENLGQGGAIIGLMVGQAESGFKTYANSNVPVSLTIPHQAVGSDHASVGVFQQQIGYGWTTLKPDSPDNQAAVAQLMDPAYSAEAFFGSPKGANAPPALSKGLQNDSGWQTKDPWVAAQDVQGSAYDGNPTAANNNSSVYGGNYKGLLNNAQQLIAKYYDSTAAVPLPVSFNGIGTGSPGSISAACGGSVQCASGATGTAAILCAAQKYAGIWYEYGAGHAGRAAYVQGCQDPSNPLDNQAHGKIGGDGSDGNPSPCAVDCSSLVSMAVDDAFNQSFDWDVASLEADHANWKKIDLSQAQPGDVVTYETEHIEIFVSRNASSGVVTTFGAHYTGTQTGQVDNQPGYFDAAYRYIGPGSGNQ